jgi:cytochrome b561
VLLRDSADRYGAVSVLLHWLTAVLVVGLFGLGLWMTSLDYYDPWYRTGPWLHKGLGVLLVGLLLLRLGWRVVNRRPGPEPRHSRLERVAARAAHLTLYGLLLAVPVAGYLISTADGRPLEVFGWLEIPALVTGIPDQEDLAGELHYWLAISLVSLAGVHALAAVKHHLVDRDRTLVRMLGRGERSSSAAREPHRP